MAETWDAVGIAAGLAKGATDLASWSPADLDAATARSWEEALGLAAILCGLRLSAWLWSLAIGSAMAAWPRMPGKGSPSLGSLWEGGVSFDRAWKAAAGAGALIGICSAIDPSGTEAMLGDGVWPKAGWIGWMAAFGGGATIAALAECVGSNLKRLGAAGAAAAIPAALGAMAGLWLGAQAWPAVCVWGAYSLRARSWGPNPMAPAARMLGRGIGTAASGAFAGGAKVGEAARKAIGQAFGQ